MEGRAIARPDPSAYNLHKQNSPPSMEGRAIARPDAYETDEGDYS